MTETVAPQSLVTLHYRIALQNGQPLIDTFTGTPATLQLGQGEMLPALEQLLIGIAVGERKSFTLAPSQAFGEYRSDLQEKVRRADMPDDVTEAMSIMEFAAPDGTKYTGLVTELGEEFARVDFNHPLAGKTICFEVEIIGTN